MSDDIPEVIYARLDTGTFYRERQIPEEIEYARADQHEELKAVGREMIAKIRTLIDIIDDPGYEYLERECESICQRAEELLRLIGVHRPTLETRDESRRTSHNQMCHMQPV